MSKMFNDVKRAIKSICIVDRLLIIFMIILFFYMILHLFIGINNTQDTNAIDIIVRTSMASIFGYFISSNFAKTARVPVSQITANSKIDLSPTDTGKYATSHTTNQIGFQSDEPSLNETIGEASSSESAITAQKSCNKTQIIIVSSIGLISLLTLLLIKLLKNDTPEFTAIISQLRDFVSVCIGFLVSCGKEFKSEINQE